MVNNSRILYAITYQSHSELGLDEMEGLRALGYVCEPFEYTGKKKFRSILGRLYVVMVNAIKLVIKIHRFKPHIIYFNSRLEYIAGTRDFITILIIKMFYYKRLCFVIKSHGSDLEVLQTTQFFHSKIIFPFLSHFVNGWLFLSQEEVEWINAKGLLKKEKVFVTKNIVRPEKFFKDSNFREKTAIPSGDSVLLFVGRLIEQKGIHTVIDAFSEIEKTYKATLIVVGDGDEMNIVKEKIHTPGLCNKVFMTGWVDEQQVAYYTSNADILVFPTFFPEGFAMVLFNSLAAGLPIITTQIRAAKDYLTEPENCLWVEPKSAKSLQIAIEKLLDNPALMTEMKERNKEKSNLFIRDVVCKELSQTLSRCCN
jgi:glycosyltransferase involved in cell wall biosynthesis